MNEPPRTLQSLLISTVCTMVLTGLSPTSGFPSDDTASLSPLAAAYLDEALDLIETHSIVRGQINWDSFRGQALREAAGSNSTSDTYTALRSALGRLGDHHSFLLEPQAATEWVDEPIAEFPRPQGAWLTGRVAYLRIVPIGTAHHETAQRYALAVQTLIRRYERSDPLGWVVDLRGNTGGNLWPMLAGLGPLLGEGTHGYFVDAKGAETPWRYQNGQALSDEFVVTEVPGPPWTLASAPRVAVLTDHKTLSSGEAIAISFRGRPHTRSFGQPTGGLVTSNENFELADGAVMLLATNRFADRTGTTYVNPVEPDELVLAMEGNPSPDDDPVVQASINWIQSSP